MASQVNFIKLIKRNWCPSSLNTFKRLKKKEYSQKHSMRPPSPSFQTRQRYHQKRKLSPNIIDEYRCKNSQQNLSQPNPTTYPKNYTPWPGWGHPRFTRMIQHMQNNQRHTPREQKKSQKSYDHLNRCRKSIWQSPTSIHDQNSG